MRKTIFFWPLTAFALNACGANVIFTDRQRHPSPDPSVVSIIYDRSGSLYPSASVHVSESALRQNRPGAPERELRLSTYFEDERSAGTDIWRSLLADAGVSPETDVSFTTAWDAVQAGIRKRAADQINLRTRGDGTARRPLVILIHGFNNTKEEAFAWYQLTRDTVRRRVPDAVFLDVHWDGLTTSLPPFVWGSAQYNFPLVGLEFRRLLNAVDSMTPVRVLTHSSGGPLIASTLGDASAPLPADDAEYLRYRSLVTATTGEYRPPVFVDFRVGMVVPAASPTTFAKFRPSTNGPDRLIFGINRGDVAVTKAVLACTAFGTTCLGADPSTYCTDVVPVFAGNPHTRLYLIDFSGAANNTRSWLFWDDHSMEAYFKRDPMRRLLNLLFGGAASDPGDADAICQRAN